MTRKVGFIGFGEAAQAFVGVSANLTGYDRKTGDAVHRVSKLAEFAAHGVEAADSAEAVLGAARIVFSLVTADQTLAASHAATGLIPGTFWFDGNSVAPDTKRTAAAAIEARGGRYVDVAIMAPVLPLKLGVPLLVSGPHARDGAAALRKLGFSRVDRLEGGVGSASTVKMIRSVMIKGLEALSAECLLAAESAGVRNAVIASLDASWPSAAWARRLDYNLDRMLAHGLRRSAEMEEVVKTLDALGAGSAMSRGTVELQHMLGALCIAPPAGLDAKLDALRSLRQEKVA